VEWTTVTEGVGAEEVEIEVEVHMDTEVEDTEVIEVG